MHAVGGRRSCATSRDLARVMLQHSGLVQVHLWAASQGALGINAQGATS